MHMAEVNGMTSQLKQMVLCKFMQRSEEQCGVRKLQKRISIILFMDLYMCKKMKTGTHTTLLSFANELMNASAWVRPGHLSDLSSTGLFPRRLP